MKVNQTVHLLAAITTITVVGVAGIVALALFQPASTEKVVLIGALTLFLGPTLAALYGALKLNEVKADVSVAAAKSTEAVAVAQEIKVNVDGRLQRLIEEIEAKGLVAVDLARAEGRAAGQVAAQERMDLESRRTDTLLAAVGEGTGRVVEHDVWEKEKIEQTNAAMAENTTLTREIHEAVVAPKSKP